MEIIRSYFIFAMLVTFIILYIRAKKAKPIIKYKNKNIQEEYSNTCFYCHN